MECILSDSRGSTVIIDCASKTYPSSGKLQEKFQQNVSKEEHARNANDENRHGPAVRFFSQVGNDQERQLLTNTKLAEYAIENVVRINHTNHLTQEVQSITHFRGDKFFTRMSCVKLERLGQLGLSMQQTFITS